MATLTSASAPSKAKTIEEFISLQNTDEITYYKYSIVEYLNGFDMFITNILYDYEDEFQDMAITVTLTSIEQSKYRYKPNLLAYDLYGTTEAGFIIMMINRIIDPKEFDFQKVKVIKGSDLANMLSRIKTVNSTYINNNRAKLNSDFSKSEGNQIWNQ